MNSILFVNVDTLKDFMLPGGKLQVPGAEGIRPNLKVITGYARKYGYKIVNIADSHTEDSKEISDTPDYITTFPAHCMQDTIGAEFIPETEPVRPYVINYGQKAISPNDVLIVPEIVIKKDATDVFTNRRSEDVFKILQPKHIYVYGVVTEICVDQAVVGLLNRGYVVSVLLDAIKELPDTNRNNIFAKWVDLAADLTTTAILKDGGLE